MIKIKKAEILNSSPTESALFITFYEKETEAKVGDYISTKVNGDYTSLGKVSSVYGVDNDETGEYYLEFTFYGSPSFDTLQEDLYLFYKLTDYLKKIF